MMRLLLNIIFFYCPVIIPIADHCSWNNSTQLNLNELSILEGKWEYFKSYKGNECFIIVDLGDLPTVFEFKNGNRHSIQTQYPKLHDFGKDKLLYGWQSSHKESPFGKTSFPIVNHITKDSSKVQITHYVPENGIGKGYSYYLISLNQDYLIIQNERNYSIKDTTYYGVNHIYKHRI